MVQSRELIEQIHEVAVVGVDFEGEPAVAAEDLVYISLSIPIRVSTQSWKKLKTDFTSVNNRPTKVSSMRFFLSPSR